MPWSTLQNCSGRFRVKIRRQHVFGLGRLARLAVHHGLAEEQLGVVGIERQTLGADRQGPGEIAQHLVAAGDQGEQLPRDRIGRRRAGQAAPEVVQGASASPAARRRSSPG